PESPADAESSIAPGNTVALQEGKAPEPPKKVEPPRQPEPPKKTEPPKKAGPPEVPPALPSLATAPSTPPGDVSRLPRSWSPQMMGDFLGSHVPRTLIVQPTITVSALAGLPTIRPGQPVSLAILVPDVFQGAFKIAENEGPRPED